MNKTLLLPMMLSFALIIGGCAHNGLPSPTESDWLWSGLGDTVINVSPDYTIVSFNNTPPHEFSLLADRAVHVWLWEGEWVELGLVSGDPVSVDSSESSYLALKSSDRSPVDVALQTAQPELITFPIQKPADVEALNLSAIGEKAQTVLNQILKWFPLELEESVFIVELESSTGEEQASGITTLDGLLLKSITRFPRGGDATCVDALPMYRAPEHEWHESGDGFCGHISTVRSLYHLRVGETFSWINPNDGSQLNPDAIKDIESKEGKERDSNGNVKLDADGNPINKNGMSDADIVAAHIRLATAKGATHEETKIQPEVDINLEGEAGSSLVLIMLDLKETLSDESKDWDCTLTMSGTDPQGNNFAHAEHILTVVQPTKKVTSESTDDEGDPVTTQETVPDSNKGHIATVDGTYQGTGAIGEGIPAVPRPNHSTSHDNWAEKNHFDINHGQAKTVVWKGKPGWTIKKLGYVCVAFKN